MSDSTRRDFLQTAAGGAGLAAAFLPQLVAANSIVQQPPLPAPPDPVPHSGPPSQPQSQRQPPPAASPVAAPQQPPSLVGGRLETRSAAAAPPQADRPPIRRLGMIGLDTSHVPAFTRLFNKELADDPRLGGLRVVAGVKAGNPDFPLSRDRVEGFTREIEQLGVQIVPDIATLLTQV
ncbi:MAG: twin-arginine translocation signal domain-containing protein, partial [Planctomycetaceae bacterium]